MEFHCTPKLVISHARDFERANRILEKAERQSDLELYSTSRVKVEVRPSQFLKIAAVIVSTMNEIGKLSTNTKVFNIMVITE